MPRNWPRESDLVCYWFEHARKQITFVHTERVGLLSTNSIRGGANRQTLEKIKDTGDIFMAWSDRPWVLNGADVRVSIVGFDDGNESQRTLDGKQVNTINSDLTSSVDVTKASRLKENKNLAFMGDTKQGPFDIDKALAQHMLERSGNPNGRPNSDVVKPWINGIDITRRPQNKWIIDFGIEMSEEQASLYEVPFEYVRDHVRPARQKNERSWNRKEWWIHYAPRPAMRDALSTFNRFIVTATVAKYRLFVFVKQSTIPDHQLIVFARDDHYFLGVLQSSFHELWALRMGTSLEDRPRYTPRQPLKPFLSLGRPARNQKIIRSFRPSPRPPKNSTKSAKPGLTHPASPKRN